MKKNWYYIVCAFSLLIGCKSAQNPEDLAQYEALEEWIESKNFEIESTWANPTVTFAVQSIANASLFPPGSNPGNISLIGNPNYFRVINDSLSIYLPYFGEREIGGAYNSQNQGIVFDGIPEQFEITKNPDKSEIKILVKCSKNLESYRMRLQIHANKNATINVNSNQRNTISYQGIIKKLPEKNLITNVK